MTSFELLELPLYEKMIRSQTNLFKLERGTKTKIIEVLPPPIITFHEELKTETAFIRKEVEELAKNYQKAKLSVFEEIEIETIPVSSRINQLFLKWKNPPPCRRDELPVLQNILALNRAYITQLSLDLQKISIAVSDLRARRQQLEDDSGF